MTQPPAWPFPGSRDLFREPLCRAEDLGMPIPDSPDACSVALPLWSHAVGYEEQDRAIIDQMQCGYPRFFFHPAVATVMAAAQARFGGPGSVCFVFPSLRTAERCNAYVFAKHGVKAQVEAFGSCDVHIVICSSDHAPTAKAFWQHTGLVVSSRRARSALSGTVNEDDLGADARRTIRDRLAAFYSVTAGDVLLFPSGMGAIFEANRLASDIHPGRRRVHLEFPFLDTLKVQQEFAGDVSLYTAVGGDDFAQLISAGDPLGAVMTEIPSNPLLKTIDFEKIMPVVRHQGGLMIVDDTLATPFNVNASRHADIIVISLTKYFCGHGDVFAGALVLNPASSHYGRLYAGAHANHEELLWGPDAAVLEERSRDFESRVRRINKVAAELADYLRNHTAIETIYYPKFDHVGGYEDLRVENGLYGGLISILLHDAPRTAPQFYDRLRISKGPSLGTNYTLVCPYTLLAHYRELDWAESHGVSRWLLRISVGMEDSADLRARFGEALSGLS